MNKSIPIHSRALSTLLYNNFFISLPSTLYGELIKVSEHILFNFALQIALIMGPRSIKVSFLNLFLHQTILWKNREINKIKMKQRERKVN